MSDKNPTEYHAQQFYFEDKLNCFRIALKESDRCCSQNSFLSNKVMMSVNPENVPRIKNGRCWKNDGQRLSGQGDFFQKGSLHMNADFSVLKKKSLNDEKFKAHFARTSVIQMFFM